MGTRNQKNLKQHLPKPHTLPKDKVFLAESNLPCKALPKSTNSVINQFLAKTIKTFSDSKTIETKIKDIFSEEDFWYSSDLSKIIITSKGIKKLIAISDVTFSSIIPLEKQCDGPSKEREQVWLEATAVFPNGTTSTEYGIASKSNVLNDFDKTILPIIAKKRATARALLNAPLIDLEDCVAAVELPEGDNGGNTSNSTDNSLRASYLALETIYKKLINELCKDLTSSEGVNIWKMNDPQKLLELSNSQSYLISYIAKLRIEHIFEKNKQMNS